MSNLVSWKACLAGLMLLLSACAVTPTETSRPSLLVDTDRMPDEIVDVWPNGPPGGVPEGLVEEVIHRDNAFGLLDRAAINITQPTLSVFRPDKPNGSALLIAPGGGYARVVIDKEGYEGARYFNQHGVTVYVLKYRLPGQGWDAGPDAPLQDAQRAIRLIRSRAAIDGVDPERVAVMGFSAGGHVAGSLATRFEAPVYEPVDAIDDQSPRPDLAALIYPVASMDPVVAHMASRRNLLGEAPAIEDEKRYSIEVAPPLATPPTFLMHASDDASVGVENALRVYSAFNAAGIPVAMKLFDKGGHGFGFRGIDDAPLHAWPELFLDFWSQHDQQTSALVSPNNSASSDAFRVQRILIAGDSTAADYPPKRAPQTGWGQALPYFIKEDIPVLNLAVNGRSTKSFIDEGKWAALVDQTQAGDLVLISFGHNDSRDDAPERYAAPFGAYTDNLMRFARDVAAKGGRPVILSPAARRLWEGPAMVETHGLYAFAAERAAARAGVSYMDLSNLSLAYFEQLGKAATKADFMWGERLNIRTDQYEQVEDNTHFTVLGACGVARLVAGALQSEMNVADAGLLSDRLQSQPDTDNKRPPHVEDCARWLSHTHSGG